MLETMKEKGTKEMNEEAPLVTFFTTGGWKMVNIDAHENYTVAMCVPFLFLLSIRMYIYIYNIYNIYIIMATAKWLILDFKCWYPYIYIYLPYLSNLYTKFPPINVSGLLGAASTRSFEMPCWGLGIGVRWMSWCELQGGEISSGVQCAVPETHWDTLW